MHHERIDQPFRCVTEDLRKGSHDAEAMPFPEGDRGFVGLTTMLNCIAEKPSRLACSSECSHILEPSPWPRALEETM